MAGFFQMFVGGVGGERGGEGGRGTSTELERR